MDSFRQYIRFAWLLLLVVIVSCTLRNRRVAGEQLTIRDTDWVLLAFGDESIPVPQGTQTSFIHFEEGDDRVRGFAGCNRFFGRYEVRGDSLNMHSIGSTRMSCADMEVESFLLGVLDEVSSYEIADNLLTLYANGEAVATFRASPVPVERHEPIHDGH